MNKLIKEQLEKVNFADLSHFDDKTNTYFIPKKKEINYEVDKSYLIRLKPSFRTNEVVIVNWNGNKTPIYNTLIVDVQKILGKMVKVNCIGYDEETDSSLDYFWSGWLYIPDTEIIKKF